MIDPGGGRKILDIVTPFYKEYVEADAKVFGQLLAHVHDFDADFDADYSTVVMVQVENEPAISGGGSADLVLNYVSKTLDALQDLVGADKMRTNVGCYV